MTYRLDHRIVTSAKGAERGAHRGAIPLKGAHQPVGPIGADNRETGGRSGQDHPKEADNGKVRGAKHHLFLPTFSPEPNSAAAQKPKKLNYLIHWS